jgi:hypothetical protein
MISFMGPRLPSAGYSASQSSADSQDCFIFGPTTFGTAEQRSRLAARRSFHLTGYRLDLVAPGNQEMRVARFAFRRYGLSRLTAIAQ